MDLTPGQIGLQARAREFSRTVARPRAAQIDASGEYPWDVVETMKEAGFLGMTIPPEYGGQERSFLDAVLVTEEMVRDGFMFTIGGGTAQVLRTLVASKMLGWKLPQTRGAMLPKAAE